MTRVLIVAPSAVVRAGLESILAAQGRIEVTGVAAGLGELAEGIERQAPDVVLVDLERGDESDSTALPAWATAGEGPSFVVLVAEGEDSLGEAMRHGARAALPRGASAEEIVAAIGAAAAGLVALPAGSVGTLPVMTAGRAAVRGGEALTPREIEVLGLMAEGAANKLIARRLGISEHTVKFHVGSILAKLGAGSRTEAVTLGVRGGLIMV